MPEMKHSFQKGRMNKDLDERLVPNGEYRHALNVEVSTTNDSDMGSLQTVMGNSILSNLGINGARCVGSIADDKNDKIYWFIAGTTIDAIAEYNYLNDSTAPVCVDNHGGTGTRTLNFNSNNLITGINVVDDIIFWTDNHSEPKRINITRGKLGSSTFTSHTNLMVRDVSPNATPNSYLANGPIEESHLTVIKRSPPTAPVLEMIDTTIGDLDGDGNVGGDELSSPLSNGQSIVFLDPLSGEWNTNSFAINCVNTTDFPPSAFLTIHAVDDTRKKVRVQIQGSGGPTSYTVKILSGNKEISGETDLIAEIEHTDSLFQFKFPRFATRYKYEDGEYSTFSPFTEVAFLPGKFDYLPKEGYNLGMVNNLRKLVIKDFVHGRLLPKDVVSIDILYKESNSPNIYSIKTVKRIDNPVEWDAWNAVSPTTLGQTQTRGYFPITSEMIHAMLPGNQLLRPWDNVPRKALGQEVVGNRLVYGNYLQNYDLKNINTNENLIKPNVRVLVVSGDVGGKSPEEIDTGITGSGAWPSRAFKYSPAKSVKTLRTYQVGVVYIDKYGRETPVFSEDQKGSINNNQTSEASVYVQKTVADQRNSLKVKLKNNPPDWATHFKLFVKETSNEYYNLAMDRWYDAEDGNIWMSFPSAERNKVDEDTFLILKKAHDSNAFISGPSRYKIIAIENEAPRFIKLQNVSMGGLTDGDTSGNGESDILGIGSDGFPLEGGFYIYVATSEFEAAGWKDSLVHQDISQVFIRVKSTSGISGYYRLKQITLDNSGYYKLQSAKAFGTDMSHTSPDGTYLNRTQNCEVQIIKKIPENRAEFEGRFFVKILKDGPLIENLNIKKDITLDYIATTTMQVQYIAPDSTWSRSGNWDGFGNERLKISVDSKGDRYYASPTGAYSGHGQDFWKYASDDDSFGDSLSSGWFIDACEAFRPWTGSNGGKEIGKRQESFNPSWGSCMSTYYPQYGGDVPPKMVNSLSINSYGYSGTSYLGMTGSKATNKIATAPTGDGGQVVRSQGVDEANSTITISYAGLNLNNGTNDGNYTSTSWGTLSAQFQWATTMTKHVNDELFIEKLLTPGTIWRWKEDPGQVMYTTVTNGSLSNSTTPYSSSQWSREQQDHDGQAGVMLYNYALFTDYMIKPHHKECTRYWCHWNPFAGSAGNRELCDQKVDWVSRNIGDSSPWCVLSCLCATNWIIDSTACSPISHSHSAAGEWGWVTPLIWNDPHKNFPQGVFDWNIAKNRRRRFTLKAEAVNDLDPNTSSPFGIGEVGPHYYLPTNDPTLPSHFDYTATAVTAFPTGHLQAGTSFENLGLVAPGIRHDGMYTGFDHPGGTWSWNAGDGNGMTDVEVIPQYKRWDASSTPIETKIPGSVTWEILEAFSPDEENYSSTNPAIWETEPKEDVGLDIYHEVGQIYPVELNNNTIEQFVGGVHANFLRNSHALNWSPIAGWSQLGVASSGLLDVRVGSVENNYVALTANGVGISGSQIATYLNENNSLHQIPAIGSEIIFVRADGSTTEAHVGSNSYNVGSRTYFELLPNVHNEEIRLPWFNCYSFGNGVESDRVRDDYNQVTIDNGPKASTTIEEPYLEERRKNGFIWSGLYNSTSGVNNLNQFIQAEKITKDVNPTYGSIQKLHVRDSDLVAFCEDRVLKVLANKDALYNADGNTNLVSTDRVLGNVKPFSGDFGISQNPESFASDSYRSYFSDTSRGAVLRLSMDGLTPISDIGMKEWFADNLLYYSKTNNGEIIGSFDNKKEEYNITLKNLNSPPSKKTSNGSNPCGLDESGESSYNGAPPPSRTLTYSEPSKGWVSFKSFIKENGVSLNNSYYTFNNGNLWEHHANDIRNNFYTTQYDSSVSVLFNQMPGSVKSFTTLNYEGSQARVTPDINNNPNYYDNFLKTGWYVDNIITNAQEVDELEFWDKEDKWFSQIKGVATKWLNDGTAGNIDPREFSYQGIGNAESVLCPECPDITSWNCNEEGGCDQISGAGGMYINEQACIDCCSPESWTCRAVGGTGHVCFDPGDGSGQYSTFCDCVNQSMCCENGEDYFFTCQNLSVPNSVVTGCMDDGITTDPWITRWRPQLPLWVGPASNYDPNANVDNCDCIYLTETSWDCIECNCVDIGVPGGQYPTFNDCDSECCPTDPCEGQNMGIDKNITDPTLISGVQPPCSQTANDGSVSVMVTNNNATSPIPFTTWTVKYYNSITPASGPPTIGSLLYSDTTVYPVGAWSNTYVGLTTTPGGTTAFGIYYAVITDNFGCQYGPFVIRVDCVSDTVDPPCDDGMDVAFIFDYTSSMAPVITSIKNGIGAIVTQIETLMTNSNGVVADYQLSLTLADEAGMAFDKPFYVESFPFPGTPHPVYTSLSAAQKYVSPTATPVHSDCQNNEIGPYSVKQYITNMEGFALNNETTLTTQLGTLYDSQDPSSMPLGNGAGYPEPTDIAIDMVGLQNFSGSWRSGVAKYIVLFTDNLPSGNDDCFNADDAAAMVTLTNSLVAAGIKVMVVGAGVSIGTQWGNPWQALCNATGGIYDEAASGNYSQAVIDNLITMCDGDDPCVNPCADSYGKVDNGLHGTGQDQMEWFANPSNGVTLTPIIDYFYEDSNYTGLCNEPNGGRYMFLHSILMRVGTPGMGGMTQGTLTYGNGSWSSLIDWFHWRDTGNVLTYTAASSYATVVAQNNALWGAYNSATNATGWEITPQVNTCDCDCGALPPPPPPPPGPCAWTHGVLHGGGTVTGSITSSNYTNPNGGTMEVSINSTQPDGPYTIELKYNDPILGYIYLYPNTLGTTSHTTTLGVAETITYENQATGMYTLRAYDVNGCMGQLGLQMN